MTNQKGFSIIELSIVMALIAILIVIFLPQYEKFQARAKRSEGYSAIHAIRVMQWSLSRGV